MTRYVEAVGLACAVAGAALFQFIVFGDAHNRAMVVAGAVMIGAGGTLWLVCRWRRLRN